MSPEQFPRLPVSGAQWPRDGGPGGWVTAEVLPLSSRSPSLCGHRPSPTLEGQTLIPDPIQRRQVPFPQTLPLQDRSDGDLSYGSACSAEGRARAQRNCLESQWFLLIYSFNEFWGTCPRVVSNIHLTRFFPVTWHTVFPKTQFCSKAVIHN